MELASYEDEQAVAGAALALVVLSCEGCSSGVALSVVTAEADLAVELVLVCQVGCMELGSGSRWLDHVGTERRGVHNGCRVLVALGNVLRDGVLGCEGKNESDHGYPHDMDMAKVRTLAGQEVVVARSERLVEAVEVPRENDVLH